VGDSIWDMQAARAAGMSPIGVASGSATAAELGGAGASLTVDNLNQVLPMIKTPI
jgi:phosphoglycolate phosphatase-like HAD superfamily hydrolase